MEHSPEAVPIGPDDTIQLTDMGRTALAIAAAAHGPGGLAGELLVDGREGEPLGGYTPQG
jgi:hypothetical protein